VTLPQPKPKSSLSPYTAIVGTFVCLTLSLRIVADLLVNAAITTAAVMFLIALATSIAWLAAWAGFGAAVLNIFGGISDNPRTALLMILAFILILGHLITDIPILINNTPVLLPVFLRLGSDPVFLSVILIISVVIGFVTPPIGILTYISCSIVGITISQAIRGLVPFCAVLVLVLLLCELFPAIVMTLPAFVDL
jgi:TRAP-type C4-dicarboxylate transport system permease large subunit